jgi:hypothetical protein
VEARAAFVIGDAKAERAKAAMAKEKDFMLTESRGKNECGAVFLQPLSS